jgi:hypothetical protein
LVLYLLVAQMTPRHSPAAIFSEVAAARGGARCIGRQAYL